MEEQPKIYYIPKNPKILKGTIYTLYINNNKNLNLSTIINTRNISIQNHTSQNQITISEQDYTRLLELNNMAHQLNTKRTTDIQTFLNEETKTLTELTKINSERQELVKKLIKGKEQTL